MLVAVALSDQIYTSTDAGVTWTPRETQRDWANISISADGTTLLASASYGDVYISRGPRL
jgi:hypothetical protein